MARVNWTPHMVKCDEEYSLYYGDVITNNSDSRESLAKLKETAESHGNVEMSGYAAYLLFALYVEGKYVEKDWDKADKYLELACKNGEPMAIADSITLAYDNSEEQDKEFEELLSIGTTRDYYLWFKRAQLYEFKNRKKWRKYPFNSLFKKIWYRFRAIRAVPKQPYFDQFRKDYRGWLLKDLSIFLIFIPLIFLIVVA